MIRVPVDRGDQWVVNFSDLHVGHPNCRVDIIKRGIEWAKEHDAICIYGGDWIENSNKQSVGAGWVEQIMPPQKQVDFVVDLFKPIKDRFIGGYIGNHEERAYRLTGFDPAMQICEKMEMPYFGTEMFAVISAKDKGGAHGRAYTLYGVHSGSGHKTSGLAMNQVQRDWSSIHADIKMKSHDHHLSYDTEVTLQFDTSNMVVNERLQHIVLTGSTLSRPNNYATKKPHMPTRLGFMPIMLNMRRGDSGMRQWSVRPCYELAEG